MGKVNNSFRYTNAADSAKPGYLARKFARIRADQAEAAAKQSAAAESAKLAEESVAAEARRKVRVMR